MNGDEEDVSGENRDEGEGGRRGKKTTLLMGKKIQEMVEVT